MLRMKPFLILLPINVFVIKIYTHMKYGCILWGRHYVVRLRVKLSDKQRGHLNQEFGKQLFITKSLKGYTLIEGCLDIARFQPFWNCLQLAKIDSKIDALKAEESRLLGSMLHEAHSAGLTHIGPEDLDLPF